MYRGLMQEMFLYLFCSLAQLSLRGTVLLKINFSGLESGSNIKITYALKLKMI